MVRGGDPGIFICKLVTRPFVLFSFKFLKLGNIGVFFEGISLAANNIISPSRFLSCFSLNLSFVSCVGVIIICLPSLYQSLLSSVSHIACEGGRLSVFLLSLIVINLYYSKATLCHK